MDFLEFSFITGSF